MKKNIRFIILSLGMMFLYSCTSRPNEMTSPVNSTMSGSHATKTNGNDMADTLSPVQPNGLDTSAEQTGRMNGTMGTIPPQKTGVSNNKMKPKK